MEQIKYLMLSCPHGQAQSHVLTGQEFRVRQVSDDQPESGQIRALQRTLPDNPGIRRTSAVNCSDGRA